MHVKISILPHMELSMCMYSNIDGALRGFGQAKVETFSASSNCLQGFPKLTKSYIQPFPKDITD